MEKTNKVIIITGAGSGIGCDCSRVFLEHGWRVALLGRQETSLTKASMGHKSALVIKCDVTNEYQVENAFNKVLNSWGQVDVLFNNAGIGKSNQTIDNLSIEDWREVVEVNLTGAFICARMAFKIMKHQKPQGGRIINNGSVSAHVPRPGSAPYTSTKHAITGLTRTISLDGRPFNIVCGQIDIGNALTPMTQKMTTGIQQPDGDLKIEPTMDPSNVSKTILHMSELPLSANVQFVTVMASNMPFIGRG